MGWGGVEGGIGSGMVVLTDQVRELFLPVAVMIILSMHRCGKEPRGSSTTGGANLGVRCDSGPAQGSHSHM